MTTRRRWTDAEDCVLRRRYPDELAAVIAADLGRPLSSLYQRAKALGLAKSDTFYASEASGRTNGTQGRGTRFQKGQAPANKGLRRPGWFRGRMRETQFKPGQRRGVAVRLYKPIGTERISKDGYRERKVNDDLPLQARWRAVHLILWESHHGPLPAGHAVVFRNGDKTDIRIENLDCIPRRELMARNTVHNLPKELASAVQLLGALRRKIRRKEERAQEQDRRPS